MGQSCLKGLGLGFKGLIQGLVLAAVRGFRKIQRNFFFKFYFFKPICHISWAIAKLLEGTQPHHQFLGKFLFKNMDFISVVAPFWTHVQFLLQDIALKMGKPKVQELLLGLDIILENR